MTRGRTSKRAEGHHEKGFALLMVLVFLGLGSLMLVPTLRLADTALQAKQINSDTLQEQYALDGAAQYAMWELLYGGVAVLLDTEGEEAPGLSTLTLNGVDVTIKIRMQATLGDALVGGAEDNRIRLTKAVECDQDGDGFDDDCLALPENVPGMLARYTVQLDQVSPDTSVGVLAVYDQLPAKFDWDPVANPVVSLNGSFPEIEGMTPVNIGSPQDQIWKWDFSASPLFFTQGQVREFTIITDIDQAKGEYCNRTFLKMQSPPHESSGPYARVWVQGGSNEGCANGGTLVGKFAGALVIVPGQTTIVTYSINVENVQNNSQQIDLIKDVLPQGGVLYCNGISTQDPLQTCDPPGFKYSDTAFNPITDSFTDNTGYTAMADPTETYDAVTDRWELIWDAGWSMEQAGKAQDNFSMRFQTEITPSVSGAYYNEIFVDVDCSVPSVLASEGVSTQADYCASYSWPSGGTLVPTYDVQASTLTVSGWGNVTVDWSGPTASGTLQSWHVE